jgi:hypothetical protein
MLSLKIDDPRAFVAGLGSKEKAELDKILRDELEKVTLGDPEWRIDNLYWIQDEQGKKVKFVRNAAQREWWKNRWYLNVILKARQLGFSTEIAIEILDECLFIPNFTAGIIDYSIDDAKKKLAKIKFAYDALRPDIKARIPLVKSNTENMEFGNGSRIEVGTSHRGGTLQHLHVSEYGKISAFRPDKAKEIKTGGFGTVHAGQRIDVESTAEGLGGEFYDLVQRSQALALEKRDLSKLDFKLHFFAWWQHPGYRLDPRFVKISTDLDEYFQELADKHGIRLDSGQRAWYAAKREQIGHDSVFQEYPSIPEEAFKASIEGAYFKRQMSKARQDGRITHIPYDEMRLVNTFWDIGNDTTSIWFHQTDGVRHRLIDYYENADESIAHYAMELRERAQSCGYKYGKHYGPHDLMNADWGGTGKTRFEIAKGLGLLFTVVPRIDDKNDAIDVARQFLGMCWFDEKYCERGIQCLDSYVKRWNETLGTWSREPLHNWASHGADSFMTGAMGYKPDREKKKSEPPLPKLPRSSGIPAERGTGWMGRR